MKFNILYAVLILTFFSCKKEVETQPVVQDIKELVFASGQVEWKNSYNLVAQTDGILQDLKLEIGDELNPQQIVGNVDNSGNNQNLKTAKEQLTLTVQDTKPRIEEIRKNIVFAEEKHKQDKIQAERYERLYQQQSVAKQEYENMQLTANNSLTQLNVLKQQLESVILQSQQAVVSAENQKNNSEIVQSYNLIRASAKGKVIKKLKTNGDFVKRGDVIATIANQENTEIILNVDESSISKIIVGQEVIIKLNTEQEVTQKAVISEILSAFDQETQSFICKAKFQDSTFMPLYGTQLEANILVGEKKNALLIPRSLLGFGNTVRLKDHKEKIVVKTGIVSTDFVEIVSGLNKDDIVLPIKP